jgi:hypothetical protein
VLSAAARPIGGAGCSAASPVNLQAATLKMSRGPGRIERVIEALVREQPLHAFTITDLCLHAYPGINRVERWHRVSVCRAVRNLEKRKAAYSYFVGWSTSGLVVFKSEKHFDRKKAEKAYSRTKAAMAVERDLKRAMKCKKELLGDALSVAAVKFNSGNT